MNYKVLFSRATQKDAEKLKQSKLNNKCKALIEIIKEDPFATFPPLKDYWEI